jgi:hypothetical protein
MEDRRFLICRRSYPVCRLGLMETFVDSTQSWGMRGDVKDIQKGSFWQVKTARQSNMVERTTFLLRMSLFVT